MSHSAGEERTWADLTVTLLVAAYGDDASAADFQAINDLGDTAVPAAVVLDRASGGQVEITGHGGGLVAAGTSAGTAGGVGALSKRHKQKAIGVDAEQWLPAAASAIAAVVDDLYVDRVDNAVGKATKKVT